jgi:hypothetical protein
MHMDDALEFIIAYISAGHRDTSYYGYDIYLQSVVRSYLIEVGDPAIANIQYVQDHPRKRELSTAFYDAAWELCRRGILRPINGWTRERRWQWL